MDYYFEKSAFSSFENSLFHTPFHTRAQNEGMTGDKHLSTEPKKHQKMAIIREKAISFSADGFGPSGESRTHGLLNPMIRAMRLQRIFCPNRVHFQFWNVPNSNFGTVVYSSIRSENGQNRGQTFSQ